MNIKLLSKIAICMAVATFSIFIAWGILITPKSYEGQITSLDQNIDTVLELTGYATAASAAVSMIPGDTATPIAEKLADFSTYFVLVLSVLYLEKFLIVLTGKFALVVCVPLICVLIILRLLMKEHNFSLRSIHVGIVDQIIAKLSVLTVCIGLVIPVSVVISNAVYLEYQDTIEASVESAESFSGTIQDAVEEEKSGIAGLTQKVSETLNLAIDGAKHLISSFVESLAIMIVVSCLIPILVILLFVWVVRNLVAIPLGRIS